MATEENFLGDERSHGKKELDDGKRRKRKKNEFFSLHFIITQSVSSTIYTKATNTIMKSEKSSSSRNNIVKI